MLELTGVASVLRGASVLYWLVAAAALAAVLWRLKSWRGKAIGAIVVVALFGFMPINGYIEAKKRQDYAREAWAYFKKLCDEKSGQKIYKTFTGVKSVLVIKPLPPATEKEDHPRPIGCRQSSRGGSVCQSRAQYAALSHIAHGGEVEYITHPLRSPLPSRRPRACRRAPTIWPSA